VIVDAVGYLTTGGNVYGGAELIQGYTPQGLSRYLGNTNAKSDTAWFRGSVSGSNESLNYSATNNTGLPVTGASLTPGGPNTADMAPLTTVASVTFDDGSGQRSMVRTITVTFSNPVEYVTSKPFELKDQMGAVVPNVVLNVTGVGSNTLTITFSGSPIIGGSLADGKYRLEIDGDNIYAAGRMVDGKGDMMPGSNGSYDFHRLFGDADGNGTVNAADFNAFRLAYGVGPSIFDFDGDNQTSAADFNAFRLRYGVSI